MGFVARTLLWAHRQVALYPDTRYLLLCANSGRKSGRVTVGESRLPVAMTLPTVREHGVEEAAIMWPQLTREELSVLERLAEDILTEERPEVDVLRDDISKALQACRGGTADQHADHVLEVLAEHGVIEGGGGG